MDRDHPAPLSRRRCNTHRVDLDTQAARRLCATIDSWGGNHMQVPGTAIKGAMQRLTLAADTIAESRRPGAAALTGLLRGGVVWVRYSIVAGG